MKTYVDIRKEWYATVVVAGGTALFQGIVEHMTKELTALAPLTRDLTKDLMKILTQPEYSFTATAEREIVPVVKEILCYVRLDHDTKLKSSAEFDKKKRHVLPDGNIITVVPNVSCCAKVLFHPNFTGKQPSGVHDTSFRCFMKYDVDIRKVFVRQWSCHQVDGLFQGTGKHIFTEPTTSAPSEYNPRSESVIAGLNKKDRRIQHAQ